MQSRSEQLAIVLTDPRIGNSKQATSLAKLLEIPYEEISLSYNPLAHLPNFIPLLCLGLTLSSRAKVMKCQRVPSLVISSGRRSARVALAMKRKYGCKVVQIMHPNLSFSKFDAIILPKHDDKSNARTWQNPRTDCHTVYVNGAVSYIDWSEIASLSEIDSLPHPRIAVLVGGSSKSVTFGEDDLIIMLGSIERAIQNLKNSGVNPSIMLTNSRRTPPGFIPIIKQWLDKMTDHSIIYDVYRSELSINPYLAFLRDSDVIIATGDSVSMCSEMMLANKELYVYIPPKVGDKHNRFLQENFANGNFKNIDNANHLIQWKNTKQNHEPVSTPYNQGSSSLSNEQKAALLKLIYG